MNTLIPLHSARDKILSRLASNAVVAVVDQGVVSGLNFITLMAVGRACGAVELGIYSLSATLLFLLAALVDALVTGPYAIHLPRVRQRCAEYSGSLVIHSFGLSSAVTLVAAVALAAMRLLIPGSPAIQALWPVALVALPVILREAARRHAFAHQRAKAALLLDACVSSMLFIGLVGLAKSHLLGSATAILLIGGASALGSIGYWFAFRKEFHVRAQAVIEDARSNFEIGRWLLGSQVTMIMQFSIAQWAVMFTQGPAQTGLLAAALSVVQIANPALQGLSNIYLPKAAQTVQEKGTEVLAESLARLTRVIMAGMACYCVLVTLSCQHLVSAMYGGKYSVPVTVLLPLLLMFALRGIAMPAYIGLWVILRAQANVYVNVIGMLAILSLVVALRHFGITGAAYAILLGDSCASFLRWFILYRFWHLKEAAAEF